MDRGTVSSAERQGSGNPWGITTEDSQPAKNMIESTDIQSPTGSPTGLPASAGSALIRVCDVCGKVNAIDLDASPEAERDMQELDHTVKRVTKEEAMEAWKNAGRCDHKALIESLRAQIAALNDLSSATSGASS